MRIDVHAHYYPAALNDLLQRVAGVQRNRGAQLARGFSLHVPIEGQLDLMDGAGIDRMVLSLGNTPPYFADRAVAMSIAQGCNDLYVDLHTRYPTPFTPLIGVPLPPVDAPPARRDPSMALPPVLRA